MRKLGRIVNRMVEYAEMTTCLYSHEAERLKQGKNNGLRLFNAT
jgi:hypothetical protein